MVEIEKINEDGTFTMKYLGEGKNKIQFYGKDLNTGLGIHEWYSIFNYQNQELGWQFKNWDKPYISGVEIYAYINNELVFQKIFQKKKLDTKYYFSSPITELSFGSWETIMYGDEYQILLNSNDVVYDLGANFGTYIMWALSQNVKQVYAFEPTSNNIEHLNQTFKWDSNVEIIGKAISNEDKTQTFYTFANSVCNSLYYDAGNPTEVECIHLENYIKNNNLQPPTVIKCDIEGAEYEFIESCSDEFLSQIRGMFLEYHLGGKDNVWGIVSRFLDLGFTVKSQGPPERGMGTLLIFKD
jgi:FkbM family methyltransferase